MGLVLDEKTNSNEANIFLRKLLQWFPVCKDWEWPASIDQVKAYDLHELHDRVEQYLLAEQKG